jgi:arsenate reductase
VLSEIDPLIRRPKIKVLFLCTNNACRSQMAEGMLRHQAGDRFDVFSAGIEPTEVHPIAIKAMEEMGVDISGQRAKSAMEFLDQEFDYVITVCDRAKQTCPVFPGKYEKIHWDMKDPDSVTGSGREKLEAFKKARNQIQANIIRFVKSLD